MSKPSFDAMKGQKIASFEVLETVGVSPENLAVAEVVLNRAGRSK